MQKADSAARPVEASETRYGPLIVVAFTTGLRRGELAGLKWTHIDFDRAVATIARAVVKLTHGKAIVKPTKTGIDRDDRALEFRDQSASSTARAPGERRLLAGE